MVRVSSTHRIQVCGAMIRAERRIPLGTSRTVLPSKCERRSGIEKRLTSKAPYKSEFDGFLDCIIIESVHNPIADLRSGRSADILPFRARAISEGNIRRPPSGQAAASGDWRRAPPPPISKSKTENGGGPRCRPAPATSIRRAPFGGRTPTDQEPDHPA